jgi:hypothetical protein
VNVARGLRRQSPAATIGDYDARCLDRGPADRRGILRSARQAAPHETGQHFDRESVRYQDGLGAPAPSCAGKNGQGTPLAGI